MDIQRIVLFAGLAIVSYLMVLAWNEDYHQPQPETAQVSEAAPSQSANSSGDSDNMVLPEDNTGLSVPNPGTEEFATPETGDAVVTQTETGTTVTDQFVKVRTDVYELTIDRVSGNLVRAQLLDYDKSLNSKQPLTLLNNTENRLYVLESGLIGRDGPDSRKNGTAP
ncbi:MAG: membrane protein insertase YidC, partial [Marinobacter sp.]|nr:membrane protein insertase YidC [Marinobacter sp.]